MVVSTSPRGGGARPSARPIKRSKSGATASGKKRPHHGKGSTFAAAGDSKPLAQPHDEQSTRAYLIAQEIKFAKLLAGNDTKISEKQVKGLRRWLKIRAASSFRKYTQ